MVIFTWQNAFKIVLETIIPFLIFVTIMFTLITKTGVGTYIAQGLTGLASLQLIDIGLIITFPLISPIVGPGAVIQQIIGTLIVA